MRGETVAVAYTFARSFWMSIFAVLMMKKCVSTVMTAAVSFGRRRWNDGEA